MPELSLSRQTLRGTWGTLLLPLRPDDSIDFDLLEQEIDSLISAGVAGIYSNGSAGEFYSQTQDEFLEINTRLARRCHAAGLPFQIGACHSSPQEMLNRIRSTKHLAPPAYQINLPDWFVVRGVEVFDFVDRICLEAAPAGIVIYNPGHAKRHLTVEEFAEIARRFSPVLGIKVPGGGLDWYAAMKRECGDLSLFIPGHLLASGLLLGGHGSYSNIACLHPRCAVAWHKVIEKDPVRGMQIQETILAFMDRHIHPFLKQEYVNAAVDKLLAAIGGWTPISTRLRWPYKWISPGEADRIRELARRELAEFFSLAPL